MEGIGRCCGEGGGGGGGGRGRGRGRDTHLLGLPSVRKTTTVDTSLFVPGPLRYPFEIETPELAMTFSSVYFIDIPVQVPLQYDLGIPLISCAILSLEVPWLNLIAVFCWLLLENGTTEIRVSVAPWPTL